MRCHPGRWLWGLIPVAMLCWLAVQAERSPIERDLERRSREVLAASGHDWASIAFDGRDGLLVGSPANPSAVAEAADLVRNVWGVRIVRTREPVTAIAASTRTRTIADVPMTPAATVTLPSAELSDRAPAGLGEPYAQREPPVAIVGGGKAAEGLTHVAAVEVVGRRAKEVGASAVPVVTSHEVATPDAPTPVAAKAEMVELPLQKPRDVAVPVSPEVSAQGEAAGSVETKAAAATVELPEQKPVPQAGREEAAVPAPQLPEHKPPLAEAKIPVAMGPTSEHASLDAKRSDVATAPAPAQMPDRKPEIAAREAPPRPADVEEGPQEVFAMPAADGEKLAKALSNTVARAEPAPATIAPLPERKKRAPVATNVARVTPAASAEPTPPPSADTASKPAPAQPPASPPRFETAALPPGNMAVDAACVKDVEAAAALALVHFAPDDSRLDQPGKALIDGLVTSLNACPGLALRISGHADASGQSRHNKTLSERRARSVAAYMVDKGIDAGRLVAVGYGDKQPVAPNDKEANRAKNRRIELAITVQRAPLPPMPVRKQGTRNGLSRR